MGPMPIVNENIKVSNYLGVTQTARSDQRNWEIYDPPVLATRIMARALCNHGTRPVTGLRTRQWVPLPCALGTRPTNTTGTTSLDYLPEYLSMYLGIWVFLDQELKAPIVGALGDAPSRATAA
jgi:hypothetical protein